MTEQYIARNSELAARMLGSEMIILSPEDSTLLTLNEPGSRIWEAADGVTPLRQIVERTICEEYEVAPDIAYADACEFTAELARRNVLLVSNRPFDSSRTSPSPP